MFPLLRFLLFKIKVQQQQLQQDQEVELMLWIRSDVVMIQEPQEPTEAATEDMKAARGRTESCYCCHGSVALQQWRRMRKTTHSSSIALRTGSVRGSRSLKETLFNYRTLVCSLSATCNSYKSKTH